MNPAPVRVQKADDTWAPIDLTLIETKDGLIPKSSPRPVTFSAGGSGPAVLFEHTDRSLSMGWDTALPKPTIVGATATYAVSPTQDLVLTARLDGFEQSVVIKKRPAVGETIAPVTLPLSLDGVEAVAVPGGRVAFEAEKTSGKGAERIKAGDDVFAVQTPLMYSAALDAKTGMHSQISELPAELTHLPEAGIDAGLTLTPDAKFLADPATVFPVTIDPVISAVDALGDTWVRQGDTATWGSAAQLNVGLWNTASQHSMTLMKFSAAQFAGNHVTDAKLNLFNSYSGSCTPSGVGVYPLAAPFDPATVTWATLPDRISTATYVTWKDFAHGFNASCPPAFESIDVTNMVSAWSFGTFPNHGLRIEGLTTSISQQKLFCAMDLSTSTTAVCNTPTRVPTLSVTYNTYPWPAKEITATPQVTGTDDTTYVTSLTPTLQAKVGNTDGSPVRLNAEVSRDPAHPAEGAGVVWSGSGAPVTPLAYGRVTVGTALTDGYHYRYRVRGSVATATGGIDYGPWSGYTSVKVAPSPPVAPTLSCTSYAANTWTPAAGTATCTVDTTSPDGAGYSWGLDNPSQDTFIADSSNTGAAKTFTVTPEEGQHTLYATARDTALNVSTVTDYTFGVGKGGFITPKPFALTQQSVGLRAQSQSGLTTLKYQYQAGSSGSTWTDVPLANLYAVGSSTPITAYPAGTMSGSVANHEQLNWNVSATLAAAGKPEGAVQVRLVFNPSGTSWTSTPTTFIVAKSAFADSASTAPMGPGTLSLVTGDFSVDTVDAEAGGLAIGRSATTLAPPAASSGPSGIFGAGWTTAAFGPDGGVASLTLTDDSSTGSVTLTDASGTKTAYVGVTGGVFTGTGDATDGSKLQKVGDNWALTDPLGTVTTWAPVTTGSSTYVTLSVDEPGAEGLSGFTRDGAGRVTRIIAPQPTGVTCTSASLVKGCRALTLTYSTATTATGTAEANWGSYTGLVQKIDYTSWNPATSAMATTAVANYLYDSTGRLRAEWDPRITPALKVRYTYDANGRLATQTDPGRATWTMTYDTTGRLASVSRPDPNTGTTATEAVAYGVALTGTNLPNVSGTAAATWGQTSDLAYSGTATFPASRVPAAGSGGAYSPAAADWQYATITFHDVDGRVVNTAQYGAGAWLIDSFRNDDDGNVTWSLSAGNRQQALTPTAETDPFVAGQSSSAVRAGLLSTTSVFSADGSDLLTTLGPAHPIYLSAGTYSSVRLKVTNTYDEGAPGAGKFHLVTTNKVAPVPLDGAPTTPGDTRTVLFGYDPIDGASPTGDTSGWVQAEPTSVTSVMGATPGSTDISNKVLRDTGGRVLETWMPESSGTGAGTTANVYYTADASASVAACRNRAEWAGLLCQTGPKSQPAGTTIPTTVTTYNQWDQQQLVTETSGTSTRTTTNGYDAAGRPSTVAITGSPAVDVGTAVGTTTTGYNATTGDATTTTVGSVTMTSVFNSLGQVTSYTDADGQPAISTYDIDGNVKTMNDGKGTYTFTYDGTDADGKAERRGLLTSLDVGMGSNPSVFTAAYDAEASLVTQNFPNGIKQTRRYDNLGDERGLTYEKSGTQWMEFESGSDRDGRTVWQGSPGSFQQFGYDNNDRLIYAEDTVGGQCTTRKYSISKNGNRQSLITGLPGTDGACQDATTTTTSSTYDTADRKTNSGYTYDKFGRTLTTPAADAAGGATLTLGYYSNDKPASMSQGTKAKVLTLDPSARIQLVTDTTSGAETRRVLNHYSDTGDSPSWINTSTNSGTSWTWQRNVMGIDGGLAVLQDQTGTPQLQLTNPHGDVVATVNDVTTATTTNAYFEQSEFGIARPGNATNPLRYAWLGGYQRSTDAIGGLALMGHRLYNPVTGRFASVDPVKGGNENGYSYPNDPVNAFDTTGLATWAACGIGARNTKMVRVFNRAPGAGFARGKANLACGNWNPKKRTGWGYRKLLGKHMNDWLKMAWAVNGSDWRSMADWGMNATLNAPLAVLYNPSNDTYEYRRWVDLIDLRTGRKLGNCYVIVVVARITKNIITSYPTGGICK